jgi:hypothetical protein
VAESCERSNEPSGSLKGKGKKLSLCLTKHRVTKAHWRSGGIAPRIIDLDARWR